MPIILTMPTITFESKGWTPCKTNLRSRSWRLHASTKCALERDPDQGGFLRLTLPEGHNVLKLNRATAVAAQAQWWAEGHKWSGWVMGTMWR